MKHPYIKSLTDSTICALCHHSQPDHTSEATCDGCATVGDCEIFGKLDNPRALLLCPDCTTKEVIANDLTIDKTKILIENPPFAMLQASPLPTVTGILQEARTIDGGIRFNGDVFNAKTIAIAELKATILSDSSISLQDRHFKFQSEVATRLEHLKTVVFELDNQKHEAVTEQIALRESLREFGNSLREDIRARIKASDATYTPQVIVKVPKLPKPKASPMERLIEMLMVTHGCDRATAEDIIIKGKSQ